MKCRDCAEKATVHFIQMAQGKPERLDMCLKHGQAHERSSKPPLPIGVVDSRNMVDVVVTQAQVANEETVTISLPDGGTVTYKLEKDLSSGLTVMRDSRPGDDPKNPPYGLKFRVVP